MTMNVLVSILLALALGSQAPSAQGPGPATPPAQTPAAPAQTPPSAPPTAPQPGPAASPAVPDSYVIGTNDQLSITVLDDEDLKLTNKYRVDESGMVTLPYLGRLPAGGKTILEFQEDLRRRLTPGYILNPQVRVDIDQYKSQSVFVLGAVRAPNEITMTGQLTLMTALAKAGSMTAEAGDEVQISHNKNPATRGTMPADQSNDLAVHVKLKDLTLGRGDMLLQDGDIVYVPPAKRFTLQGQVKNPGSLVWEPGLTVDQAIARAGGLTERGSMRGINARRMVNGKMKDVSLDPRSEIQPDDVVTVKQRLF
jgi:polysaccharide export outer membrane protein